MSTREFNMKDFFAATTYILLFVLVLVCFWAIQWIATAEFDVLVLFLIAYTLILVLPITDFELSAHGFKAHLDRLARKREETTIPSHTIEEVKKEVQNFSRDVYDPDVVLMKLSIEIEKTLRDIAVQVGLSNTNVGILGLVEMLKHNEVLTDKWLIEALDFFRVHRNELFHKGKTSDIEEAIDVSTTILAKLREIQQKVYPKNTKNKKKA